MKRVRKELEQELVDLLLDWVVRRVEPDEVFGSSLKIYISENYNPEDIFSKVRLDDWAFENGYRRFE